MNLAAACISYSTSSCRFDIDNDEGTYHIKAKDKETFDIWFKQFPIHIAFAKQKANSASQRQKTVESRTATDNSSRPNVSSNIESGKEKNSLLSEFSPIESIFSDGQSTQKRKSNFETNIFFLLEFRAVKSQLNSLASILEQIRKNSPTINSTRTSVKSQRKTFFPYFFIFLHRKSRETLTDINIHQVSAMSQRQPSPTLLVSIFSTKPIKVLGKHIEFN